MIAYSKNKNDRNHEGQFLQLKQHLIFPSLSVVVEYCMMRFITPNVLHPIHFIHEVWHFCCWITWHRLKCFSKYSVEHKVWDLTEYQHGYDFVVKFHISLKIYKYLIIWCHYTYAFHIFSKICKDLIIWQKTSSFELYLQFYIA